MLTMDVEKDKITGLKVVSLHAAGPGAPPLGADQEETVAAPQSWWGRMASCGGSLDPPSSG